MPWTDKGKHAAYMQEYRQRRKVECEAEIAALKAENERLQAWAKTYEKYGVDVDQLLYYLQDLNFKLSLPRDQKQTIESEKRYTDQQLGKLGAEKDMQYVAAQTDGDWENYHKTVRDIKFLQVYRLVLDGHLLRNGGL